MQLNSEWFNDQIAEMGQEVLWRRAFACPCRDPHSGAAVQGCPACAALGWFWDDGIVCLSGMASMRVAREFAAFGAWESGDVVLTLPSNSAIYAAGEKDRIVMRDSSEPFTLLLTRGTLDRMRFPLLQIDRIFYLTPPEPTPVTVPAPPVGPDGTLLWDDVDPAVAPPAGSQYAVSGRKRPEFYLFTDLPQDRAHFGGAALPRRVQARRFDLFGRGGG